MVFPRKIIKGSSTYSSSSPTAGEVSMMNTSFLIKGPGCSRATDRGLAHPIQDHFSETAKARIPEHLTLRETLESGGNPPKEGRCTGNPYRYHTYPNKPRLRAPLKKRIHPVFYHNYNTILCFYTMKVHFIKSIILLLALHVLARPCFGSTFLKRFRKDTDDVEKTLLPKICSKEDTTSVVMWLPNKIFNFFVGHRETTGVRMWTYRADQYFKEKIYSEDANFVTKIVWWVVRIVCYILFKMADLCALFSTIELLADCWKKKTYAWAEGANEPILYGADNIPSEEEEIAWRRSKTFQERLFESEKRILDRPATKRGRFFCQWRTWFYLVIYIGGYIASVVIMEEFLLGWKAGDPDLEIGIFSKPWFHAFLISTVMHVGFCSVMKLLFLDLLSIGIRYHYNRDEGYYNPLERPTILADSPLWNPRYDLYNLLSESGKGKVDEHKKEYRLTSHSQYMVRRRLSDTGAGEPGKKEKRSMLAIPIRRPFHKLDASVRDAQRNSDLPTSSGKE